MAKAPSTSRAPWKRTRAYHSWVSVVKSARTFDLNTYRDEMESLHKSRTSRFLLRRSRKVTMARMSAASMKDVSVRSRLTEIAIITRRILAELKTANQSLHHYLNGSGMITGRTQPERKSTIYTILKPGEELALRMEQLISDIEFVISDIDKAAWALKLQVEAMQAASRPEMVV